MSSIAQAAQETNDMLFYMGISPEESASDPRVAALRKVAFTSVIEFGEDSMHPSFLDAVAVTSGSIDWDEHQAVGKKDQAGLMTNTGDKE